MPRIYQLPPHEAQKIAAGEVVERPANIAKELIENALDAGATEITLFIEDGGKKLLRVIDNGCGMSPEDARLSLHHHATSKIKTVDELSSLVTYGFRGEALSSIASVSFLRLQTKEEAAHVATVLDVEGAVVTSESSCAANRGTDISVRDLFYNVPARKKFLKTRETEFRAITQLFTALCLAHEQVYFKFYHDGKLVYQCPPVTLLPARLAQLFEQDLVSSIMLKEVYDERMNIRLHIALTDPRFVRYDRHYLYGWVNKRWVKNHKIFQALLKGYRTILPAGKFPAGFIFLTVDPSEVDVNIHPRKDEVQFLHPRVIESLIEKTTHDLLDDYCTRNLGALPAHSPEFFATKPTFSYQPVATRPVFQPEFRASGPTPAFNNDKPLSPLISTPVGNDSSVLYQKQEPILTMKDYSYRLLGQLLHTYILIETAEGLVLIDQHAAHERIMYERFRSKLNTPVSVPLLFPQTISLSEDECTILESYLDLFFLYGLSIDRFDQTHLVIKETPVFLKNQVLDDLLKMVVGWVRDAGDVRASDIKKMLQEKIHAQMSCKASVKAGDELTPEAQHELVRDLQKMENKTTCPHGRPTIWLCSAYELEKRFKRVV